MAQLTNFWIFIIDFKKYFLKIQLTCDTDSHIVNDDGHIVEKEAKEIAFLDMDIFKANNTINSKEHRKETSVNSYISINSAHPRHTFAGIVKSQLYRLRRLCSRDVDFKYSVEALKVRCLKSGYKKEMVLSILGQADSLERSFSKIVMPSNNQKISIRLVVLSGTLYEKEFSKFAKQMNSALSSSNFKVEIVKSTSSTIGKYLFNNNNKSLSINECSINNCIVCPNELRNMSGIVKSVVKGTEYKVEGNLTCNKGGIYVAQGVCSNQYTGKTIVFGNRCIEHLKKSNPTAIYDHMQKCQQCNSEKDFTFNYVESYLSRGKYSLSEREMLWNERMKGLINVHKTLKSS